MADPGWIVILNGVPRAGKSSIARAIIDSSEDDWINLGVDAALSAIPEEHALEAHYRQVFSSIADQARLGANVVSDFGLHSSYVRPFDPLALAVELTVGLPVLFVGVRCPLPEIMRRRNAEPADSSYAQSDSIDEVPEPVRRWQEEVHRDRKYDLEVDTSRLRAEEAVRLILSTLPNPPRPLSFDQMRK